MNKRFIAMFTPYGGPLYLLTLKQLTIVSHFSGVSQTNVIDGAT